jgi:hypothetical protein
VYDASMSVPDTIYNLAVGKLAGIKFVDQNGGRGRIAAQRNPAAPVYHADPNLPPHYLPTCVTDARYMINVAHLRAHNLAGVSLCGKNHFGSIWEGVAEKRFWPGYPIHYRINAFKINWGKAVWDCPARPMGSYNPLVELMAHKDLGGKTLLFVIDGLYSVNFQSAKVTNADRWYLPPFNGGWSSSIFSSQDCVAIDSVGLDFLRTAGPAITNVADANNYSTADDYLHEAAMADAPPSGTKYDPQHDGTRLKSLGAHEHWNNAIKRQYSRNLKTGNGIELVSSEPVSDDLGAGSDANTLGRKLLR